MKSRLMVLLVALVAAACESSTSHYPTLEEARADRLFERGWLPDILPPSAYEISAENDLDLNRSHGTFSIAPQEFEQFIDQLVLAELRDLTRWNSIASDVKMHISGGYPVYRYRESGQEWIFLCLREQARCHYYMS